MNQVSTLNLQQLRVTQCPVSCTVQNRKVLKQTNSYKKPNSISRLNINVKQVFGIHMKLFNSLKKHDDILVSVNSQ